MVIIFWDFLKFDKITAQVKRSGIFTIKRGIYECLMSSRTTRIPPEMKILSGLVKISWKTEIEVFSDHFKF